MVGLRSLLDMLSLETEPDLSDQVVESHLKLTSPRMIVLTNNVVSIHHGHHLLLLLLPPPPPVLAVLRLVITVVVVLRKAEGFGAECDKAEDECYDNKYNEKDDEDDGEGVKVCSS